MQRNVPFVEGEFYHVYNRGVERREIFTDEKDYSRFLKLLFIANGTKPFNFRDVETKTFSAIDKGDPLVAIGAYCLMPNHFHILVREIIPNGTSMFMEKLATGYSMYFNRKHKRTGTLFQGPFKAEHVPDDNYLKYLFAYIHLNPIKIIDPLWKENGIGKIEKAKKYLQHFEYSSYVDFTGSDRDEKLILSKEEFPEYFIVAQEFESFVHDWLDFNNKERI